MNDRRTVLPGSPSLMPSDVRVKGPVLALAFTLHPRRNVERTMPSIWIPEATTYGNVYCPKL